MDDELRELVQAAVAETDRGGLAWKAFNEETFRAPIASGTLHVRREHTPAEDADGSVTVDETYRIEVSDDQGRVVAEADATVGCASEPPVAVFAELFEAARKSALKPTRVIREMIQALRNRRPAAPTAGAR